MNDKLSEAERVRKAIVDVVKEVIKNETRQCFRVYKAKVTAAPADNVCSVQMMGDESVLQLPFSSRCASVQAGDFVWIGVIGNNFRNAIIWEKINFS